MTTTTEPPASTVDLRVAELHAANLLSALGITGDDETPARLARALHELAGHRNDDPRRHLEVTFPPTSSAPGLVVVQDVPFVSLCEHHVLPFTGVATLGYLPKPNDRIVGLSKMARLVQEYAARPQVQERLADQVVTALQEQLTPRGAACALRGRHSCMALRGARTGQSAAMVTVQFAGELHDEPWRGEFNARLMTAPWVG